jgi:hypothetical protein
MADKRPNRQVLQAENLRLEPPAILKPQADAGRHKSLTQYLHIGQYTACLHEDE